jgi:hypothetical protein
MLSVYGCVLALFAIAVIDALTLFVGGTLIKSFKEPGATSANLLEGFFMLHALLAFIFLQLRATIVRQQKQNPLKQKLRSDSQDSTASSNASASAFTFGLTFGHNESMRSIYLKALKDNSQSHFEEELQDTCVG